MATYKIQNVTSTQKISESGTTVIQVMRVAFFVGDNGPFFEEFTKADFTPENVRERLQKTADTIGAIGA